jgi:hypothetical protein
MTKNFKDFKKLIKCKNFIFNYKYNFFRINKIKYYFPVILKIIMIHKNKIHIIFYIKHIKI